MFYQRQTVNDNWNFSQRILTGFVFVKMTIILRFSLLNNLLKFIFFLLNLFNVSLLLLSVVN